ncbi:SulP family inorganic anion transporter [Microbacterium excoecariae]|uniref:SulP family inorganic anion transporter n=1 Tax=Microbacterium excoecariae TaxID=2715210 RepID=UPI00140BA8CA|nr:SulP family inorganic anion transporter [Microbacterium excoecariae]NHI17149.1 STAS domain-containing protein [Microbacterium excoecariae]
MRITLAGVNRHNVLREATSGVTLLAIAVPLNIGYAQIAGLPATAGLYALVLPTVLYALLASSRQVVASPDAAAAALVASSVGGLAAAGSDSFTAMVLAQAILSGVMFILLAVFRLGFLANFLSRPILVGFVGGLAVDILVSQLAKMLGVGIDSGGEFVDKVAELATSLGNASPLSIAISGASVAVLLLGKRLGRAVPWALVVMVVATTCVVVFALDERGVAVLGDIPAGPPRLTWPVLAWNEWLLLIPSAMALTMVTTAEGLLVARSYASKRGYAVRPNRDLFAFGIANIASGAQGSFAVGSSTSRTAAMDQAGSRTQLPSVVLAAGTLLMLLFGTALLRDVPSPAIGAIVAIAVAPLVGVRELRQLWRLDRFEFAIAGACFVTTLLVGSIAGILVAFVLALINIARRASRPAIDVLAADDSPAASLLEAAAPGALTAPGILVVRLQAPLFFANADVFAEAVRRVVDARDAGDVRHVVIDMEAVSDIDVTAAESFAGLCAWLERHDIAVSFSRFPEDTHARAIALGLVGSRRIFETNRAAVQSLGRPDDTQGSPAS